MNEIEAIPPQFPKEPIDTIATPFQRFIHTETSGGIVLLLAGIIALVIANSPVAQSFDSFWNMSAGLRIAEASWEHSLRHWVNDGLMTLFFFVVGLEIKREITSGELSRPGAVILPIVAAMGGMAVPAALYLSLTSGTAAASGWGVVTATDIAFVVGCLALLGRRIPDSLRVFVLALAILDDIGAILVIAIGYGHAFHPIWFAGALAGLVVMALIRWLGVRPTLPYWLIGLAIWVMLYESGIHPVIAGAAIGLLTPAKAWVDEAKLDSFLKWGAQDAQAAPTNKSKEQAKAIRRALERAVRESLSPLQRLESGLHPWSAFVILPLFALANAGVSISVAGTFNPLALAIIVGLIIGKPLGIFGFSWLAVRLGLASKPNDVSWPMLMAAGIIAGIGFTMALFIGQLAFDGPALQSVKSGILLASVLAGAIGTLSLIAFTRDH